MSPKHSIKKNYEMSVKEQSVANKIAGIVRNIFSSPLKSKTISARPRPSETEVPEIGLPDDLHRIQSVMKAVVQMDSRLKTPFSMYIGGYDCGEISRKLNVPVETIHTRISLARRELQNILELQSCQKN